MFHTLTLALLVRYVDRRMAEEVGDDADAASEVAGRAHAGGAGGAGDISDLPAELDMEHYDDDAVAGGRE